MICPNLSNPQIKQEFDELKSVLGEDLAYLIWDRNNGYHLDKAPNGQVSKLFNSLLTLTDRKQAIEIKAKTLSQSFKLWFGNSKVVDENNEPLMVYHYGSENISEFKKDFIGTGGGLNLGEGFYFTPSITGIFDSGLASDYMYEENPKKEMFNDGKLYPVFLTTTENDIINIDKYYQGEVLIKNPNQIKSIFNSGVYNRNSDNIYDTVESIKKENRQQTKIYGSIAEAILSDFKTYFPDYDHFNDEQRLIVAKSVEDGKLQLTCKF